MLVVVMGVSGSGKSTVGSLLAQKLQIPFIEGDNFHPPENIEKMRCGTALTEEDRVPWLTQLRDEAERQGSAVVSCSALTQAARSFFDQERTVFIWLDGDKETIRERLKNRSHPFMNEFLLDSQFEAFETPTDAFRLSIEEAPEALAEKISRVLR